MKPMLIPKAKSRLLIAELPAFRSQNRDPQTLSAAQVDGITVIGALQ
jgi:hypothetical protein